MKKFNKSKAILALTLFSPAAFACYQCGGNTHNQYVSDFYTKEQIENYVAQIPEIVESKLGVELTMEINVKGVKSTIGTGTSLVSLNKEQTPVTMNLTVPKATQLVIYSNANYQGEKQILAAGEYADKSVGSLKFQNEQYRGVPEFQIAFEDKTDSGKCLTVFAHWRNIGGYGTTLKRLTPDNAICNNDSRVVLTKQQTDYLYQVRDEIQLDIVDRKGGGLLHQARLVKLSNGNLVLKDSHVEEDPYLDLEYKAEISIQGMKIIKEAGLTTPKQCNYSYIGDRGNILNVLNNIKYEDIYDQH